MIYEDDVGVSVVMEKELLVDIAAGLSSDQECSMDEKGARTIVDASLIDRTFAVCDRCHSLGVLPRTNGNRMCVRHL